MIDLEFLNRLTVSTTFIIDLDEYKRDVHRIHGEIVIREGKKTGRDLPIGELSGYRIHSSEYKFSTLDAISQDLCDVAEGIEQYLRHAEKTGEELYGDIYIIDRISIEKKYRDKGVGKCFLAHFIYNTTSSLGDIVFVNPQPFELKGLNRVEFKKEAVRLARYYKNLGFKKIKGSHIHYFLCEGVLNLGAINSILPSRFNHW